MRPAPADLIPPFLFAAQDQSERRWMARLKAEGRIRPIGPRVYTSLPEESVAAAARGAWITIVAALFPGALVSHRTALEYMPSPEGIVYLTSTTNRRLVYPGLTIEFVRGPGPRPDDRPFLGLHASSVPRALLENVSRDARRATTRTVDREALERRLEQLLLAGGEDELNKVRDRARELAAELGWRAEYERLDRAIGALLGTRAAAGVTSAAGRARAVGEPFDTTCFERLQILFGELRTRPLPPATDAATAAPHLRNKAFFESYFSNYIEGTRFDLEEAEAIVFENKVPAARPIDAHDILGTFQVVSDPNEMRRTPASPAELLDLLRARHLTMLGRRQEVQPGQFKQTVNRAGETIFVHPAYVAGTLKRGYELYIALDPGLARAIFMMFLVADVHPFQDGNGRIARVMMNAELHAARAPTILIPTVYRDDYLLALRALTRRHRPTPLVDALARAAAFSRLDFTVYPRVLAEIQGRNWFREPEEARLVIES